MYIFKRNASIGMILKMLKITPQITNHQLMISFSSYLFVWCAKRPLKIVQSFVRYRLERWAPLPPRSPCFYLPYNEAYQVFEMYKK